MSALKSLRGYGTRYLSSLRRNGRVKDEITNFLCVMSNWTEVHIFMDATVLCFAKLWSLLLETRP